VDKPGKRSESASYPSPHFSIAGELRREAHRARHPIPISYEPLSSFAP
jgi:hypothetical protein